ncbi:MAG: transporter substrate-binding domain-containing protein [Burkholderiales bacterium]|jgi:glutamate/aspartate transport system substrate-binding protein|nr:transporter substrate-binding domain-containing protein [Burkholderiales bacterium]
MKLNSLAVALLAFSGLQFGAGSAALAQELTGTLKKVKELKTITLGHRESSVPFSFLDDKQQPVGYSMDLCDKVVSALKAELKIPDLKVIMQPVTSANRINLLGNGTIDLECGSTTNTMERQRQVAFGITTFVANVKTLVKKNGGIKSLADLNGKPIATTSGSTAVQLIKAHEKGAKIDFKEIYGKDHAESFLLVEADRAVAFVMDDVLLAGLVANSRTPEAYRLLDDVLRAEPYSLMLRKDDPQFKALVDKTLLDVMKSGEIKKIYARWFESSIPPRGINLRFPMSQELKEILKSPNDKGI